MAGSVLAKVCTPENIVMYTNFSTIYRAILNLGNNTQFYDIEYFRIPFDEKREYFIKRRYHIDDSKLEKFYTTFLANLKNGIRIVNSINKSDDDRGPKKSTINYLHQEQVKHDDGTVEIYLVSEPVQRYLETVPSEISVNALTRLSIRLCGALKSLNSKGYHIGVIEDFSSLGFEASVKLTNFIFARQEGNYVEYPLATPFNTPADIRKGKAPTEYTDAASLTMLFISLVNGTYNTPRPDTKTIPEYMRDNPDIGDALTKGRNGQLNLKDEQKMMTGLGNMIPNSEKIMVNLTSTQVYDPDRIHLPDHEVKNKEAPAEEGSHVQAEPVQNAPVQKARPVQEEPSTSAQPPEPVPLSDKSEERPRAEPVETVEPTKEVYESIDLEGCEYVMFDQPIPTNIA